MTPQSREKTCESAGFRHRWHAWKVVRSIGAVRQRPRTPRNWRCSFAFFESFLWHFNKKQRAEVVFILSRPVSSKKQENGSGKQRSLHAPLNWKNVKVERGEHVKKETYLTGLSPRSRITNIDLYKPPSLLLSCHWSLYLNAHVFVLCFLASPALTNRGRNMNSDKGINYKKKPCPLTSHGRRLSLEKTKLPLFAFLGVRIMLFIRRVSIFPCYFPLFLLLSVQGWILRRQLQQCWPPWPSARPRDDSRRRLLEISTDTVAWQRGATSKETVATTGHCHGDGVPDHVGRRSPLPSKHGRERFYGDSHDYGEMIFFPVVVKLWTIIKQRWRSPYSDWVIDPKFTTHTILFKLL